MGEMLVFYSLAFELSIAWQFGIPSTMILESKRKIEIWRSNETVHSLPVKVRRIGSPVR